MLAINVLVDDGSIDINFFSVMEKIHDNLSGWSIGAERWNIGSPFT
jgi:hypothetical protein